MHAAAAWSVSAGVDAEVGAWASDPVAPARGGWPLPVSRGELLLMVWLAGALAVLGYTVLSLLHVRLVARRARELRDMRVLARAHGIASELGVTWPVEVLEGEPDAMPITFGVVSGTLLLPASARSWSAARLEAVLRHELAHIRRRDSLMQLVAEIGCALYWFHPGVWLAARRLRVEREHACDDVVLLAGALGSDYARELLEIARTMRARPALGQAALAVAQPSRLRARLVAVLEDRPRAARLPGTLLAPFATAALVLVMTLAVITPSWASQPPEASGAVVGDTLPPPPPPPAAPAPPLAAPAPPVVAPAPPAAAPPPPPVAPPSPRGYVQAAGCWGRFTGDGTAIERDGGSTRVRIIQKTVDGVRFCMRLSGDVELDASGTAAVRSMGPGAQVILASREADRELQLDITPDAGGLEHVWLVDGERRPFDADAAEWRDAVLGVMHSASQIASIRGEAASLRGQIASVRGRQASLRGEIASIRGREASMRGEIASVRGRISALESARRATMDPETRSRIEAEMGQARASIEEIERRIAEYNAPRRSAEIEARLGAQEIEAEAATRAIERRAAALDAEGRIAAIEARLQTQERRLAESLRRIP
jgi:beta-lactamase regulating signal transducer with metallopeptidase domain